ncbi:MAG: carboxypeptidase regulatory-like domain-containing protein [Gemmatimonadetes bacterium]|nr:carboxypeptidase regulatory-like domain-containing protein [Gemmatimonadota bacterium]
MRIWLTALALGAVAVACGRAPETTIQVQGTVTAVGSGSPVRDAEVTIEWPRGVGGGGATMHTDRAGRYAAGRAVRQKALRCTGMTVTVRKRNYASVYNAYSDSTCGPDGIVTLDFKLIPLPQ